MDQALRLGLVGVGRWGRNFIRTIASEADLDLVGVASRNPETRALVGPDCQVFRNWDDLVTSATIDGMIIATPPTTHAEITLAALQYGIPVLVEKPLTLDVSEAQSVLDLAMHRSGIVLVEHTHLYSPAFRAVLQGTRSIGKIRRIASLAGNVGPFRSDTPPLWDWGAHDVAMCLAATGIDPTSISADELERKQVGTDVGVNYRVDLQFEHGFHANLVFGNAMAPKARRFSIECDGGVAIYDDLSSNKARVVHAGGREEILSHSPAAPLTCAVRAFADAIRSGEKVHADLELGVSVVCILDQISRSLNMMPRRPA